MAVEPSSRPNTQIRILAPGVLLLGASWALMWTQQTYWNPLFFTGTWLGAALVVYGARPDSYPGVRKHLLLAATSVGVWWWFELVNTRVDNWEYIMLYDYGIVPYALLASLAFSTVVPALDAAWGLTLSALSPSTSRGDGIGQRGYAIEVLTGATGVVMTFAVPDIFFPLVWVAPFLVLDGLVGYTGGRSIAGDLVRGEWRLALAVGLAGLVCGFLWEFWNYRATPKWVYDVPYVDFLHVFEMPLLGYAGYIPFAWSVYQLLHLRPLERMLHGRATGLTAKGTA